MEQERRPPLSAFWILHILGWLAYAGASAFMSYRGRWTDVPNLLLFFAPFLGGFLTCIPLRYFFKKIRLHERSLTFFILTALTTSFLGTQLWMGISILLGLFLEQPDVPQMPFIQFFSSYLINGGIPLLGWTSLYFGIKIRREWKQQERRTEQANSLAQAAQLQMLRYQLNPHFLFNSMNSIRALIDEDEAKAREMITELSEFLRYSLVSKNYSHVPLKDEIEAVQHYLAIQKKRYEDKLEILCDIEPEAGEFQVLSFLIHPLIENAIKYGMRTSPMPLTVQLKAIVRDGSLKVEVRNTGQWLDPAQSNKEPLPAGTGTGLDNVRRRLENVFPGRHRFEIFEKEGSVYVQLEINKDLGATDEQTP
jgi:two-component system LytT family sensor kinase